MSKLTSLITAMNICRTTAEVSAMLLALDSPLANRNQPHKNTAAIHLC